MRHVAELSNILIDYIENSFWHLPSKLLTDLGPKMSSWGRNPGLITSLQNGQKGNTSCQSYITLDSCQTYVA